MYWRHTACSVVSGEFSSDVAQSTAVCAKVGETPALLEGGARRALIYRSPTVMQVKSSPVISAGQCL